MPPSSVKTGAGRAEPLPGSRADQTVLREVVEALAPLERRAGSPGEREAAHWISDRLAAAGCRSTVEDAEFLEGYARPLIPLGLTSAGAGLMALTGRARRLAAAIAATAAAAVADDIQNGTRIWRRLISRPQATQNVVAETGQRDATRTLVVLAHHDAAQTGQVFDQRFQHWLGERFPGLLERMDTSLPLWWPVLAAPVLVATGAVRRSRRLAAAGVAGSLGAAALGADILRSPTAPGANDNLSGVAVLIALAERLVRETRPGLRVLLVSCGAEEVLQGGIHDFCARHLPTLDREQTWVLCLDTVGSPRLILVEGEGPVIMEEYWDRTFRDRVVGAAERAGVTLRRGMRGRFSLDAIIPSRARFPTAALSSTDWAKALTEYHQMTDTPENLHYDTVADAVGVTWELLGELAAGGPGLEPARRG